MVDINSVTLIGRLTKDVEVKYSSGGSCLAKGTIAVNTYAKEKPETSFFDFTIWGKLAESLSQYCTKGKQIALEGELRQNKWEDSEGKKQSKITINVKSIQLLGGKKEHE